MGRFPKAERCPRRRVAAVTVVLPARVKDLAVLVLDEPVPAGVEPAPLRFPSGQDLVGRDVVGVRVPGPGPGRRFRRRPGRGRAVVRLGPAGHQLPVPGPAGFQRRGPVVA